MTEPEPREKLIEALTKPFPRSAIKSRELTKGGRRVSYVDGTAVIQRLNAATGNDWNMSVKSVTTTPMGDNTLYIATVALTIPGLGTREHIGVQVTYNRSGEDMIKGCVTDALKKAATLFGVGIELYGEDYDDAQPAQAANNAPRQAKTAQAAEQPAPAAPAKQSSDPDPVEDGEATKLAKWRARLRSVALDHGISPAMLDRLCIDLYNCRTTGLSQEQITALAADIKHVPLSTYQYIEKLPKIEGKDHMANAPAPPRRGPGEQQSYPPEEAKADAPKGNAAQAAAQVKQRQERFADVPDGAQPVTQRQNRYMWAVVNEYAKANSLDADEFIHGQIAELYGLTSVTQMNRRQSSDLIDRIQRGDIASYVPSQRADPVQRQELFGNGAR